MVREGQVLFRKPRCADGTGPLDLVASPLDGPRPCRSPLGMTMSDAWPLRSVERRYRWRLSGLTGGSAECGHGETNLWRGSNWTRRDRDLRQAASAPFVCRPQVPGDIRAGGLYHLLGRDAEAAIRGLRVDLDDLVVAWERYLEIGGAAGSWRLAEKPAGQRRFPSTRAEVDFTAGWLDGIPYEGKSTEGVWLRETQIATAAYGRCVLATRNVTERISDSERQLFAIPAPMLAVLIDPHPGIEARRACPAALIGFSRCVLQP